MDKMTIGLKEAETASYVDLAPKSPRHNKPFESEKHPKEIPQRSSSPGSKLRQSGSIEDLKSFRKK